MLFNPLKLGSVTLPNRILLAPLTRTRADAGHLPNDLMTEYYSQRATGGLLITECTMVAPGTSAFINEPGIYNDAQIAAWKQVTQAVHAKGGRFRIANFYGLWAVCVDSVQRDCACQTRGFDSWQSLSSFQELAEEFPVSLIQNVDSRCQKAIRLEAGIHSLQLHYRA